jgi:hypothetical protein
MEDWISTISFLIGAIQFRPSVFLEEGSPTNIHLTIRSICQACTSTSHVRSLVDEGILDYWDRVLTSKGEAGGETEAIVLDSIAHLTSIDNELTSKISFPTSVVVQDL